MGDLGEIEELAMQDELKPGGVFQDLPWEILKMVLENLPEREIKKTRRLSSWYYEIVTELFPSLFHIFNIKNVQIYNENDIIYTLGRAMLKTHNKGNTMKLQFEGKLTTIVKEMIIRYQESILALDIQLHGDEDFLIQPSMNFDLLESLSVELGDVEEFTNQINITESLIVKHASKLNKLSVSDLSYSMIYNMIYDLSVPTLPCLGSLTVDMLNTEPAWSLFRASKQTITSLDIRGIDMNTQPPINNADDNEASSIYQVPNLQNLAISGGDSSKFLIHNATNLVSLKLSDVELPPELPELPQLRELNTSVWNYLLISKCKESLKCLMFRGIPLDFYTVTMPQLTDLYIENSTQCGKFLSYNHKSLEFICLQGLYPTKSLEIHLQGLFPTNTITLDDGVKMERVKTVVLKYAYGAVYIEEDRARMAELFPNAEILMWNEKNDDEMKEFVLSNHKRRGFTSNLNDFMPHQKYVQEMNPEEKNLDLDGANEKVIKDVLWSSGAM